MEARVARLEEDVGEVKATLRRLEPMIVRMDAVIPHLATKSELELLRGETKSGLESLRGETKSELELLRGETKSGLESLRGETKSELELLRGEMRAGFASKPSHGYLWGILATLIAAYASGLAALAVLK